MRKKISFVIVTIVVALTIPLINIEAKTLRDYITEVEEMIKELENYDEERAEAQARAKEKEQEIAEKYANIEKYSLRIQEAKKEIEETQKTIEEKEEEIKELLSFLQITNGENVYLEYVFGATDFTDFIFRTAVVEQLSNHNDELIVEMNELITKLEEEQKQLEIETKNEEKAIAEQNKLLAQINVEIEDLSDIYTDKEAQVKGLEEEIEYLRNAGCDMDEDITVCLGVPYASGFYLPVKTGIVTSEFGYRVDPLTGAGYVYHKGIDIALADWNPVYAAASGTVGTIVRKARCGGNIVYVKHLIDGKEYTTRYLHLSSIEVSTGDTVTINTIIGYSGGGWTGKRQGGYDECTTGAHLHFEINTGWTNIQPQNPRNYLYFPSRW